MYPAGEIASHDPVTLGDGKRHRYRSLLGPQYEHFIVGARLRGWIERTGVQVGVNDQPVVWTKVAETGKSRLQASSGGRGVQQGGHIRALDAETGRESCLDGTHAAAAGLCVLLFPRRTNADRHQMRGLAVCIFGPRFIDWNEHCGRGEDQTGRHY
ncbi:hypothetical protein WH91_06795 [Devosia psychrophila]|uniref:Uncharacterized protein n=1 Tax=Devosia psychrophila TaxID=728005 RepID=A0ABR5E0F1_9HYPH|nr:hypothetical protein WH91_06795 [Devosia psychrophila]